VLLKHFLTLGLINFFNYQYSVLSFPNPNNAAFTMFVNIMFSYEYVFLNILSSVIKLTKVIKQCSYFNKKSKWILDHFCKQICDTGVQLLIEEGNIEYGATSTLKQGQTRLKRGQTGSNGVMHPLSSSAVTPHPPHPTGDPVFTVNVKKVDGKFDVTVFDVTVVEVDVNFFRCNPLSPNYYLIGMGPFVALLEEVIDDGIAVLGGWC